MGLFENMKNILSWDDVRPVADQIFSIWVDQPELKWAKQAWEIIIQEGLADYSNENERCEAAIRFLALCGIYYDFCQIAFEEHNELYYGNWAEELEVPPIRVGLRLGYNPGDWINLYEDEEELFREGIKYLADQARAEVWKALCKGFGQLDGRKEGNEADLFLSLWKSNWSDFDQDEDDEEDGRETDWEILNDITEGKAAAYEWISSECESLH